MSETLNKEFEWRNLNVRRDREFESLVDSLVNTSPAIFQHIKDLMVFAAMIGFSKQRKEPITSNTIPITMHTYSNDQQDGLIYMIALLHTKDGNCLRDEELMDSIKTFEEYCRGGLLEIQSWVNQNPTENPIEILLSKINEQFSRHAESTTAKLKSIPLPKLLS